MVISGSVINIIFRNTENGYTVLDFDADNSLITVVGIFPEIREGELLTLVGDYVENPRYGKQFEATQVTFDAPTDVNGIYTYLASGAVKGIGEKTAGDIVAHFGIHTLDVMEFEPERLREVKGIGRKKAKEIAESFAEQNEQRHVVLYLQRHGIPLGQCMRIYRAYGANTIEILEENPYRLVSEVDGFGFLTADRIAAKLGIAKDSEFRFIAGLTHVLQEGAQKAGHTYLPQETLLKEAAKVLETEDEEKLLGCLQGMQITRKIVPFQGEYGKGYALQVNFRAENAIAGKLIKLIDTVKKLDVDAEREIEHYESTNRVNFHPKQREAVHTAVQEGVMIVTGGPGTGKTTIIRCIVTLMEQRGLSVMLAAPTGRAAKRMSEATGREAKTIHRLLGVQSDREKGMPRFKYNELNQLETDVVIVDEISMADIFIFQSLLAALPLGARLILVGDKDQLPSVSCGNVLSDILHSGTMPAVHLTEIYRQDADSLIIENAHRINRGEMPVINNRSRDFFVIQKEGKEIFDEIMTLLSTRLPQFLGVPAAEIQVLSPVKKGVAGVDNLNIGLQNVLNKNPNRMKVGETEFREGDKVMHIQNNYDLKWTRFPDEEGEGVFNGDIGTVTALNRSQLEVTFDDGRVAVYHQRSDLEELRPAYAVSVHKSQGSEFKAVVVAVPGGHFLLMNRNLLYTAVTRAKNAVVLVGSKANLQKMVANNYTALRYTMLKDFLCQTKQKANLLG